MKKIISVTVCFIIVIMGSLCVQGNEITSSKASILHWENKTGQTEKSSGKSLQLLAKSAVIIDGDSGRVLYGKDYEKKMAMASTTKIMTCIVALENAKTDQIVEISQRAAKMPKVHMNVIKGEQYYMKDLLYAMMLESYNDVAVAVAEGVAGSVEEFAKLMNKKAKEIGAVNTNFVTPNGLDAEGHYSTAYDMALIGAYAVKNKKFLEITNTKTYHLSDLKGQRSISVYNRDAFLTMDYEAVGIKTGFTGKAGYCFVGAVKSKGRTFVTCVLACGWPPNKSYKWKDTTTLMQYGKSYYQYKNVMEKDKKLEIHIEEGTKPTICAHIEGGSNMLLSSNDNVDIVSDFQFKLPIKRNDVIGYVNIYINDVKMERHEIISEESVEKYDFKYCLKQVINNFILQ